MKNCSNTFFRLTINEHCWLLFGENWGSWNLVWSYCPPRNCDTGEAVSSIARCVGRSVGVPKPNLQQAIVSVVSHSSWVERWINGWMDRQEKRRERKEEMNIMKQKYCVHICTYISISIHYIRLLVAWILLGPFWNSSFVATSQVKQFTFAGTKDKRAATVQQICAHRLPADQLRRTVLHRRNNFGCTYGEGSRFVEAVLVHLSHKPILPMIFDQKQGWDTEANVCQGFLADQNFGTRTLEEKRLCRGSCYTVFTCFYRVTTSDLPKPWSYNEFVCLAASQCP